MASVFPPKPLSGSGIAEPTEAFGDNVVCVGQHLLGCAAVTHTRQLWIPEAKTFSLFYFDLSVY